VGRSLGRKKIKDGARRGVKAKTIHPTKPDDWTDAWAPDSAWGLVKASLMVGKSIAFLTVKSRAPTEEEIKRKPTGPACGESWRSGSCSNKRAAGCR
jgi:hypothetical protein